MKMREIINIVQENASPGILYHGTSLPWLVRIIQTDRLTPEVDDWVSPEDMSASLSRSFAIASKFASIRTLINLESDSHMDPLIHFLPSGNNVCGAVIVFNKGVLEQKHALIDYDDGFDGKEEEERIVGVVSGIIDAIKGVVIQNKMEYFRFKIEVLRKYPDLKSVFQKIENLTH